MELIHDEDNNTSNNLKTFTKETQTSSGSVHNVLLPLSLSSKIASFSISITFMRFAEVCTFNHRSYWTVHLCSSPILQVLCSLWTGNASPQSTSMITDDLSFLSPKNTPSSLFPLPISLCPVMVCWTCSAVTEYPGKWTPGNSSFISLSPWGKDWRPRIMLDITSSGKAGLFWQELVPPSLWCLSSM